MDTNTLQEYLSELPLGQVIFFPVVGSTNTEGMQRAEKCAPHLSLIAADEQTAGRGRMGRTWYSPPGAALAFSMIIRPEYTQAITISQLTGLGALAVCDALQSGYQLPVKIKWPNDVLVRDSKLAGVLVEAQWQGDEIQSAVLGIGINVARNSVPSQGELDFPATSVESVIGTAVDRWSLLKEVLRALLARLPQLDRDGIIDDWETKLAYHGKIVQILRDGTELESGRIEGLSPEGYLRLRMPGGKEKLIRSDEVKLRQVDRI